MSLRTIPHTGDRVESGAIKFGDDWPGLFLRGDTCIGVGAAVTMALQLLSAHVPEELKKDFQYIIATQVLKGLNSDIESAVLVKPKTAPSE